jgi:CRISPR type III-B/RAMP module-associated protein Cmr3
MSGYDFHIEPRDLLFLRDGRPMEASDAGLGANFPRGDQIWNAFINAFHNRWPEFQTWEGRKHHFKDGVDKNSDSSFRFGGLKTFGPFPYDNETGEHYFPTPLDLSAEESSEDGVLNLTPMSLIDSQSGETDLPKPLTMAFSSSILGKTAPPRWISSADFAKYLSGEKFVASQVDLYDAERNIGIAIDADSGTTVEGKLYQAEYLRFRPGIRLATIAECVIKGEDKKDVDLFAKIADEERIPLIFGGQQGVATAGVSNSPLKIPKASLKISEEGKILVKWTLLSPAVFPAIPADSEKGVSEHSGGWLPTWVDAATGNVMLPSEKVERKPGERRSEWRERIAATGKISAKLAAARVGKPITFSGWDLQTGPKPTMMAVPAGSVYVFECESRKDATAICAALDSSSGTLKRRSTMFGEKGFGIGVCSIVGKSKNEKQN